MDKRKKKKSYASDDSFSDILQNNERNNSLTSVEGNVVTPSQNSSPNSTKPEPQRRQKRKKNSNSREVESECPINSIISEVLASGPLPLSTKLRPSGKTADWDEFLSVGYNLHFIPPVTYFKNAPLAEIWEELAVVGKRIEVPNPFVRCSRPVNWIATIRHFAGYKALIEFECFGVLPRHAAWMSFCSDVPKHIGYSDKTHILLHPPHSVRAEIPNFIDKVRETVQGCNTVDETHGAYIALHLQKSQRYPLLSMLEVMDRDQASRMRVATVTGIIGNRIHVTYVIEPRKNDVGYWFDVNSEYIHPIGFSQTIGHEIYGVPSNAKFTPLSPSYFPQFPPELVIYRGQVLEARHPLRPYQICGASVLRVLKYGYFVVEFRTTAKELERPISFTFHATSPYVLPCGFCEKNKISLVPPFGEDKESFRWKPYLEKYKLNPVPLNLIPERPTHLFKTGMKFEACGIIDPTYLGPVTVRKVREHLLYLSFDGWPRNAYGESDTEIWAHAESSGIYPIGFAEMVGHNFQGRVEANSSHSVEEQLHSVAGSPTNSYCSNLVS